MATLPNTINDFSTSAAANFPANTDPSGSTVAELPRRMQAIIKKQFVKGVGLSVVTSGILTVPQDEGSYDVSGTGFNITGLSSAFAGRKVTLKFISAGLTLVNSSSFKLPNNTNYVTKAGDVIDFIADSTSVWIAQAVTSYITVTPPFFTTAGTVPNYTVTIPGFEVYTTGVEINIKIHATNTGNATINVNALGGKTILSADGFNLLAGDLPLNGTYKLVYDGTVFRVYNFHKETSSLGVGGALAVGGTLSVDGTATFKGNTLYHIPASGNSVLELGPLTGGAGIIDFHSGATYIDYDVRIASSGGNGANGGGTLTVTAATLNLPANTLINGVKADSFPVGTRLWFYQAAAPTGWTTITTTANATLISASPTGGTLGGGGGAGHNIVTGCTVVASHTHTVNPASVTTSSHAGHAHNAGVATSITTPGGSFTLNYLASTGDTNPTTTAGSHTHTVDIPSTATTTNTNLDVWQPIYYTNVLGQKA